MDSIINKPDELEQKAINKVIETSANPIQDSYSIASARILSQETGQSMEFCLNNLQSLYEARVSAKYTPGESAFNGLKNSVLAGNKTYDTQKLMYDYRTAVLDNKTDRAKELEAQINANLQEIESLSQWAPKTWYQKVLNWTAGTVPYTTRSAMEAATVSTATQLGIAGVGAVTGTLATGTLATGTALGGPVGTAVAGVGLGLIGAAATTAGTVKITGDLSMAQSFWEMMHLQQQNADGTTTTSQMDVNKAQWLSLINGTLNGITEAELGISGAFAKKIGGVALEKAIKETSAKLLARGAFSAIGRNIVKYGKEPAGEFLQEGLESLLDDYTKEISYSLSDYVPPEETQHKLKNALESGIAGFTSALIMGMPFNVAPVISDVSSAKNLRTFAEGTKSREFFKKVAEQYKPEETSVKDWNTAMSNYWDKVNKNENVVNGVKVDSINRLQNGSLYAQDTLVAKAGENGIESRRFVVGNPQAENGVRGSNALLSIDYELSRDGNTIEITNVTDAGQESVTKEAIISLMEEYPNAKLSWETGENERFTGLKNDILTNPTIGQGMTKGRLTGAQREAVATKLSSAFTNLSNAEISTSLDVLDLMASSLGMSTSKFLATKFDESTFSAIADGSMQGEDAKSIKGYADFLQGGKAIVYAGEHADFSTFVHEVFHVYEKASDKINGLMEAVQKDKDSLKGYVATHYDLFSNGEFGTDFDSIIATINEAVDNWVKGQASTVTQSELMARLFEGYLKDGKTFNTKLDSMFARIKQWMSRIYHNMQGQVNLSDDIIKAFDAMLTEQELNDETQVLTPSEEGVEIVNNEEQVLKQVDKNYNPKETGIGYKVFYLKDGKLYPPMVANLDREGTVVGDWIIAEAGEPADKAKVDEEFADVPEYLRRYHVNAGGKGTHTGKQRLAYRPGWHLGQIPYAVQFNKGETIDSPIGALDKNGEILKVKRYFPKDFVFAEVEYVKDKSYQAESDERMTYNKFGKKLKKGVNYQGGLNHVPTDGYYIYRTNANPATDAWVITGAMKVTKVLTTDEVNELVTKAGRTPLEVEDGAKITEEMVAPINNKIKERLYQRDTSDIKQGLNDLKKVQAIARKAFITTLSADERISLIAKDAATFDEFKRTVEKEVLIGSARIPRVTVDEFARTTWAFVKEMDSSEDAIYNDKALYGFARNADGWKEVANYISETRSDIVEALTNPNEMTKENWLRSEYEIANAEDSDTVFSAGAYLANEKELTRKDEQRDKDFLQFVSTSDGMAKFEEAVGDKMPAGFGKEDFESKYDIISRDTRYARFLYADATGSKKFAVGNVEGSMPEIYDPAGRMRYSMSEAERKVRELELKTQNKELKDAIKNGNVEYIKQLSNEIIDSTAKDVEALASKVTELQNALTEAESQLKGSEEGEKLFKAVYSKLQAVTSELQDTKAKAKFDLQETKANEREKAKIALDEQKLNDQIKLEDQKAETEEAKTWEALNGKLASLKMDQARKLSEEVATLKNELKGAKAMAVADRIQAVLDTKKAINDRQAEKKAARDLKATMQKLADYITSPTPKTVDVKIAKEIEQLVAQSGIDPNFRSQYVTLKTGDRISLDNLKQILEENGWDAVASDLTISTLNRLFTKPLNDWTLSDLEALAGQVQSLRELGKRVLAERKAREQAVVEQIQNVLRTTLKNSGHEPDDSLPGTMEAKNKRKKGNAGKFREIALCTFNIEHVCRMLDNGKERGDFFTVLVRAKRLAQDAEFGAIEKRNATIAKALQDNGLTMTDLMRKVTVDGNTYTVSQLMYATLAQRNERSLNAYMFGNLVSQKEKTDIREQIIINDSLSENEKDERINGAIKALGMERYDAVMSIADANITEAERNVMEAIWTDMNSQLERINEIANEIYNLEVKAEDGYLPIQRIDNDGKEQNSHEVMAEMLNVKASMESNNSVFKGFTQDRIDMSAEHQGMVNDDLASVYHRSVSAQEHFIAFSALNKRWNSIFRSRGNAVALRDDIMTYWGNSWADYLTNWMNTVITPQNMGETNKFFRALRGNPAAAYLAWKPSGVILQFITSPAPFLSEVSPLALTTSEIHTATHFTEVEEFIFAHSNFMKSRSANVFIEMQRRLAKDLRANKAQKALDKFNEIGMQGLEMADKVSVYSGWMALYNKKLNQLGGIETEEIARQCAQYADDIVHKTQPLGDQTEIAPLFTNGNNVVKAVLQFQTSMNTIWNNIIVDSFYDAKDALNKNLSAEQRMIAFKRVAGLIGGYMLAGLILGAVADGYEPDKDDDKKVLRRSIYYTTTQFTGSVPMVSSIMDNLVSYWVAGDKKPVFTDSLYPGIASIQQGITASEWSTKFKNIAYGTGILVGAPVSGIKQAARAVEDKSLKPFIGR